MDLINIAMRRLATELEAEGEWDTLPMARRRALENGVLAVLSSLRDPDERMADAGAEIVRNVSHGQSWEAYCSDAANTWRFMVDALLSEK